MNSRPPTSQKGGYALQSRLAYSMNGSNNTRSQPINDMNNKMKNQKSHGYVNSQINNKTLQLELQLRQSKSQVEFLKQNNKQLLEKLSYYERKCQDMRILEQELDFRREQQKSMQVHLDNYKQINGKLRERVLQLESEVKSREMTKKCSRTTCQQSDSQELSRQLSRKSYLNDSSVESNRKSVGQSQKQNHPLTPKSRVSINFDRYSKQMDSMHLIKERRKVFL